MLESAKVRDVMVKKVITIGPDAGICGAARLMREQSVYSLPVIEGGKLIGIITARDIVRRIIAEKKPYEGALVAEHMTKDVITVGQDESVTAASMKMHARRIGQLPVVEDGRVVGMISQIDIVQHYPNYFKLERADRRWTIGSGAITTRPGYR